MSGDLLNGCPEDREPVMSDLIERLRLRAKATRSHHNNLIANDLEAAADEIEHLTTDYNECYQELIETDLKSQGFEARIEVLEDVLDKLARLGNEPHYGNSDGNVIAQKAIAELELTREHWFCEYCGCNRCLDAEDAIAAAEKEESDE